MPKYSLVKYFQANVVWRIGKSSKNLEKTPLYSHMTNLDLFLKAGLHFIYKLAMMQL